MKTRMRKQYYCEFCKKNGGHAGIMRNHEDHCTGNPDRECGMCNLYGIKQIPVSELLKLIPDPIQHTEQVDLGLPFASDPYDRIVTDNKDDISASLKVLRKKTGDCPACILAAIRQKNICGHENFFPGFDFKKESKEFMSEFYENQRGY